MHWADGVEFEIELYGKLHQSFVTVLLFFVHFMCARVFLQPLFNIYKGREGRESRRGGEEGKGEDEAPVVLIALKKKRDTKVRSGYLSDLLWLRSRKVRKSTLHVLPNYIYNKG